MRAARCPARQTFSRRVTKVVPITPGRNPTDASISLCDSAQRKVTPIHSSGSSLSPVYLGNLRHFTSAERAQIGTADGHTQVLVVSSESHVFIRVLKTFEIVLKRK